MISIEGTNKTPTVFFDEEKGILNISGRSLHENPSDFFTYLIGCIHKYEENPIPKIEVNMELEYFNSCSAKYFLGMFKALEKIHEKNKGVIVNWHYEADDEGMMEAGEDYDSVTRLPFNLVEIPEKKHEEVE